MFLRYCFWNRASARCGAGGCLPCLRRTHNRARDLNRVSTSGTIVIAVRAIRFSRAGVRRGNGTGRLVGNRRLGSRRGPNHLSASGLLLRPIGTVRAREKEQLHTRMIQEEDCRETKGIGSLSAVWSGCWRRGPGTDFGNCEEKSSECQQGARPRLFSFPVVRCHAVRILNGKLAPPPQRL